MQNVLNALHQAKAAIEAAEREVKAVSGGQPAAPAQQQQAGSHDPHVQQQQAGTQAQPQR